MSFSPYQRKSRIKFEPLMFTPSTVMRSEMGGVAFWAHVGGLVAVVVLMKLFARSDYLAAHRPRHWRPPRLRRDF